MNCDKQCNVHGACPFAPTEESEIVQNYGCLPTPHEIINMRVIHGKTWACHDDPSIPCKGAINHLKEKGLQTEQTNWYEYVK